MFKAAYPRTIWLVSLSLSAIVLCTALFFKWMPNQQETQYNVEHANSLYSEADKLKQAVKKKNNAIQSVKDAETAWLPVVQTRTPGQNTADGGINLNVNAYQLLLDTKRYRNNVQRAINKQLITGGVKVIAGPRVPGVNDEDPPNGILASYYNYPAVPFPVVIYDLGQVQIQGTYDQIMKHVRAWDSIPHYLAVTHNLQINGTAPLLSATYDLTVVGYIRYDGIYGPVPDGGAPAGGAGGPGGNPFGPGGGPRGGGGSPFGPGGPTRAGGR